MSRDFNIDNHMFSKKPLLQDHVFDQLRDFDPVETYKNVKNSTFRAV